MKIEIPAGFKIGHYTDPSAATGCTVIICPDNNIASCYIAGASPGSRETALLAPERKIRTINAILLTGGSAFGLNAAAGVMQYLEERNLGYITSMGVVPIVPAAVIFDLNIGNPGVRPTAENAYQACQAARHDNTDTGCIGAGTGATVGKWAGLDNAMKSGLGIAFMEDGPVQIMALSVVNAVGDIIGPDGKTIAGALDEKNRFRADADLSIRWQRPQVGMNENTVICAVLTNARLDKMQAYLLAKRSQNGLVRAVNPANTNYDGDLIFTVSSNHEAADIDVLNEMGAEVLRRSIIDAAMKAHSLAGVTALCDLEKK